LGLDMNLDALRSALALVAASLVAAGCAANPEDDASTGATSQAQTREHILLARQVGLTTLARSMGTADGRIVLVDDAGSSRSLVVDRVVYTAGASIYASSRTELCEVSRAGLASCRELAAAPDATELQCDGLHCSCIGKDDCLTMIYADVCRELTLECSNGGCSCEQL
jgi:hypothetical protein